MDGLIAFGGVMALITGGLFVAARRDPAPRLIQRYARARGLPMARPWELQLVRHGVVVRAQAIIRHKVERTTDVTATVVVPSGLTLPKIEREALSIPIAGTPEAWAVIREAHRRATVSCEANAILVRVHDAAANEQVLDAMIELAARLARWDDGLSEALHALPGAAPLEEHELDPAVVLAPDDLMIGVRGGRQLVAQLAVPGESRATARIIGIGGGGGVGGDGEACDVVVDGELPAPAIALLRRVGAAELLVTPAGARLTWAEVERDPACLRAGVDALRAIRPAAGPYR